MSRGFVIAIDLGTSNTVAVVRWPDGRTRPLLFDGQPIMPSSVYLDEAGQIHVGRDAQRMALLDPSRCEPNPKRRIDERTVLLGQRDVPVEELLAAVLRVVAAKAVEVCGGLPTAVLSYPAAWGTRRRSVLQNAAARAGWPPVRLIPEPVAAARYFTDVLGYVVRPGACLAVFDFGGGTLDVAVVRRVTGPAGSAFTVLGYGGAEDLGGLDIDAAVVDHLAGILDRSSPDVTKRLAEPVTTTDRRHRRLFWEDVRGAKEMLSRTTVAPIPVPGMDQALHVTRDELEKLATPLVERAVAATATTIQRCRLARGQLAGVFLVGGASRIPLVARLLHARLGIAPTVLDQPEVPVAEGALAELSVQLGQAPAAPARGVASALPPPSGPPVSPGPAAVPSGMPPEVPPAVAMPQRPWFRRRSTVLPAAAVLTVLVVVAGILGYKWMFPYSERAFEELRDVATVKFAGGVSESSWKATAIAGGRAVLAVQKDKQVEVVAAEVSTGREIWRKTVGDSEEYRWLVASGSAVVLLSKKPDDDSMAPFYLRDARTGDPLWERKLRYDDWRIRIVDDLIVYADKPAKKLHAVKISTGQDVWSRDFDGDLWWDRSWRSELGAAWFNGGYFEFPPSSRLLLVDDRARVIDPRTGREVAASEGFRGGVQFVYEGTVYTVDGTSGYSVQAYELGNLSRQKTAPYQAGGDATFKALEVCGERLICVQEGEHLVALDAGSLNQRWRKPAQAPSNDLMIVPVGDRVMLRHVRDKETVTTLFDTDGGGAVKSFTGNGGRVDAASVLVFPGSLDRLETVTLSGLGAQSGKENTIGAVKVRPDTCSWNDTYLVCAGDGTFGIWRFR